LIEYAPRGPCTHFWKSVGVWWCRFFFLPTKSWSAQQHLNNPSFLIFNARGWS
jgi:hypothetical protein